MLLPPNPSCLNGEISLDGVYKTGSRESTALRINYAISFGEETQGMLMDCQDSKLAFVSLTRYGSPLIVYRLKSYRECKRTRSNFYPSDSTTNIPRRSNRRRIPNVVEPEIRTIAEIFPMADRTMEELLQAPTEGDVSNDAIKFMLFPYSLEDRARIWRNNFQNNQGYRAQINNASNFPNQGFQNQPFSVPNNQIPPSVPNEFLSYIKSNEIAIKSMQNQINVLRGDFSKQEENIRRNLKDDMRSIPGSFFQNQPSTSGTLPSNTVPNPKGEMKAVTTRSGLAYEGPSIHIESPLEKVDEQNTEEILDKEHSNSSRSTTQVQPLKLREKATNQMEKFFQIFHDLHFDISFADALLLMPKFASTIKSLLANKDILFELAKVLLNENCSAMLLKKLPEKLGDPGKFLIPCDFPRMEVCHALADLGASINLMPLSIWKKLSFPELTPTRMTLELADRSITRPKGVTEDVFFKMGKFHFPTDFAVVDFKADPRVPLILGRSFLRTSRALIDLYGEEITLRVNDESITFNLNQTMRYSSTYGDTLVNRVDVIDIACEDFVQDVLDFQYNPKSSNPTLVYDELISENDSCKEPIVKSSLPTLAPFGESDFFLEEIKDFLNDDSIPTGIENFVYDPEGDILFLEKLLNEDPFQLPLMDLKLAEESKEKSSVEEPPELELKEFPSHLEYAFLEDSNKLPKISNIKGIDPRFCTHKILMEDDYKLAVQSYKKVNPKIHDVIKKEVIKLLYASMIYPISDSTLVIPIHCVPKKRGTFQRCMMSIFHDMIEKTMEKKLTEAPILVVPDWNLPFELMCDASDYAIGVVLGQPFENLKACHEGPSEGHHGANLTAKKNNDQVWGYTSARNYLPSSDEWSSLGFQSWIETKLREDGGRKPYLVTAGDHRKLQLNELSELRDQAYENSVIYKERTKKLHDSKIKNHIFNVGDQVLLFNSYLKLFFGKLKTRWSGPFTITHVFPYGTIELSQPNGSNFKFPRVMQYGITHRLATAYHPQTSGQVEISNRRLKRILERTVGENRASWSDKLDVALLAFCTAYKTPTGCTPYKLVYGKLCHLPIELEHKAYWALKHVNFDLKTAGDHRKLQLNELSELRDQAYENSMIYKERTKNLHEFKIKNRIFNVGDQVLLFNSCLKIFSGKLKTRWSGPFTITQVFLYGTIKLSQPNGPNFKVNGHRVKHYFGGDIPSNVASDLHTFPMDN
uniref:Reverse transcriptase domain-containing protein n=1 Tax=Tanacetum cinerariifolium TaxID=118510 RepID=A0A699H4N3_TANCI|nr:reverse transcriptase domain-containing protein [Tanacetum cinerariifolium]